MDKVFVYWDNSNIFISSQQVAAEREGDSARYRVRLDFRRLLELACAEREIEHAIAVGSIPPKLRHVWNRLENEGVTVQLLERGALQGREQGIDQLLRTAMLCDALDYNGDPGIVVLLTGDGSGFADGVGFTPILGECGPGDGESRSYRGVIAAIARYGSGLKKRASLFPSTISTTALPSLNLRARVSRSPTRDMPRSWTSRGGPLHGRWSPDCLRPKPYTHHLVVWHRARMYNADPCWLSSFSNGDWRRDVPRGAKRASSL